MPAVQETPTNRNKMLLASDRFRRVLGHYLLFEAGDDHQLLDSAVIETNLLPVPSQQNWNSTSPYYNLCQVLYT